MSTNKSDYGLEKINTTPNTMKCLHMHLIGQTCESGKEICVLYSPNSRGNFFGACIYTRVTGYHHVCNQIKTTVRLVEQEMPILPEHLSSPRVLVWVRSLVLCVCFVDRCLSLFYWPLCCLSFFDLRILITPLVSSNSSYRTSNYKRVTIYKLLFRQN